MQKSIAGAFVLAALWGPVHAADAGDGFTTGCTAARAYDVRLTSSPQTAEVRVTTKRPTARMTGVLLRSPYKSEATALPTVERVGDTGESYVATFDLEAIRALPQGDVNVVIVTPDGERICRVKSRNREKLVSGG